MFTLDDQNFQLVEYRLFYTYYVKKSFSEKNK
jgi:hypothetical protein